MTIATPSSMGSQNLAFEAYDPDLLEPKMQQAKKH